ncbi:MAG: FAD-dependent oxidoreductase [Synechococcus sp.]|nr:FAD-dependent oxidoreductase [Synechococcus sp.]
MLDVAIIGAGLAGIYCGRELQGAEFQVALFDKSRGIGGRLATRRVKEQRLDHGLPYWEVLGEHTAALTELLIAEEILQPWTVATTASPNPADWATLSPKEHWMAPMGMTAIAKYLAQDLIVYRGQRLITLQEMADHWQLVFDQGEPVHAKQVVLALPLPQVITLTNSFITVRDRLWDLSYDPALSLMVGYETLKLDFPWQALRLSQHPTWHTISREGEKRSPTNPTLLLQTTGIFTQRYLDAPDLTSVAQELLQELQTCFSLTDPLWWQIHRWRYAVPNIHYGQSYYQFSTKLPLIACGDWCLGSGIEGAIASGIAVGHYLSHSGVF